LLGLLASAVAIQNQWMADYAVFSITHRSAVHLDERGRVFSDMHFPLKEIRWLEDDEISWMGEKYDLLRFEVEGDTLLALAYHDAEEKDLENRISEGQHGHRSEGLIHVQRELPPFICTHRQTIILFGLETCGKVHPSGVPKSNRDLPGVFIPPCLS